MYFVQSIENIYFPNNFGGEKGTCRKFEYTTHHYVFTRLASPPFCLFLSFQKNVFDYILKS